MPRYRGRPLFIGNNLDTRRPVYLSPDRLVMHMLLVGGTGSGKTVCLESMARQAIRNRTPLIFLDPKGTTYERLVAYCYRRRITDRLYLIDPNDDRYRPGINYFDLGSSTTSKKVGLVKEAIYRALGRTKDSDMTITFERWGGAALSLLSTAGLTLADFHSILVDEKLRYAALARTEDPFIRSEWRHFAKFNQHEQDANLKASINRAALFAQDPAIYEMLGQPNTIDWQRVMNEGGIVLVNLAPMKATEQLCRFLGIMLIHQIYHAALERPKKYWTTPCYLMADEFADIICPDFKEALQKLREFGVACFLALQNLVDLRAVDPDNPDAMLTSVLQNTETKFVLKMRDYDEALNLAKHLFGPQVTGLEVKDTHTSAIPHTHEEDVSIVSSTAGRSHGLSGSISELLTPDGMKLMSNRGDASMDNWSSADSITTTRQQRVEYEYQEIPVYWSLEETFHRFARQLTRHEQGEGSLQYNAKYDALHIKTELPERLHVDPAALADYTASIYDRMHALPPAQARQLIEVRRRGVLETARRPKTHLLPQHITSATRIAVPAPKPKAKTPVRPEHRTQPPGRKRSQQ